MISFNRYRVVITNHTLRRCIDRRIDPDIIEETIQCGKVKRHGKHGIKFIKRGKKRTITLVGEIKGNEIYIFTVEAS